MRMNNSRKGTATILTESLGILEPSLTGVESYLQAIEVEVSEDGNKSVRLVIVHAYYPKLSESDCEKVAQNLRPHFQNLDLYFVIEDRPGESEIYTPVDQGRMDHFYVAAAVTKIKYSWGWDEVNPMIITFVDASVCVSLSLENETWILSEAQAG
jgi:hypothetical protein